MTNRTSILRGMRYAIVEVPTVGQRTTVRGVYKSLRDADRMLHNGQVIMQVVIDALLEKPGADETLRRVHDAACGYDSLPDNVIKLDPPHARGITWLEATQMMHSVVIASKDLYAGQPLTRDDVFRLAFRANAIRCTRKRRKVPRDRPARR